MSEPTFWRPELWHPLTLHFPVALLILATLVTGMATILTNQQREFWQKVGSFLLLVGALGAWVTIYTGDLAEGIVARTICDPILLKDHESAAYTMAWLFTGAVALQGLLAMHVMKPFGKALKLLTLLLMLVGSGYLIYSSHLGVHVVYEQGGGVQMPSSDCNEIN